MSKDQIQHRVKVFLLIADFMRLTRVEQTVQHLGFRVITFKDLTPLSSGNENALGRGPAEPVFSRDVSLIEQITAWQPALIVFDLDNHAVPWTDWIGLLKSSPATRRVPILCFVSHVDVEAITTAQDLGADQVYARSRFFSNLPDLLAKAAKRHDYEAIEDACLAPMSEKAAKGIEYFNDKEFFEAHEWLEEAWKEDHGPSRNVYKAVLQIAVAYLQIERRNYRGAVKMFLRSRQWLDPLPKICRGIDIDTLRKDAELAHAELVQVGSQGTDQIDRALFKPIQLML